MGERESRLPNEENETMMMTFHSRRRVESYKTDRWDTRENTKAIDIFLISFCWLTFHTNDTDTLFSLLASCLFLNSLICFVFRVCLSVQLLLFLFFRGKCSCALHFGTHINNNCWSRYIYIYTKQTDGEDTSWNKRKIKNNDGWISSWIWFALSAAPLDIRIGWVTAALQSSINDMPIIIK